MNDRDKLSPRRPISIAYIVMFLVACFYEMHVSTALNRRYVMLYRWVAGQEKLPFQRRNLLIPLLRFASTNPFMVHLAARMKYHNDPMEVMLSVVDFLSLIGCGYLATKLYDSASTEDRLRWAPSALVLVFYAFTSILRYDQRFIFPYDMLGMFLFTLGIYLIFHDRLWTLLVLMPFATFNRESTMMWVPLVLLATWYRTKRVSDSTKMWIRSGIVSVAMVAIWLGIQHYLHLLYINNDASEDYPRFQDNIMRLMSPKKWDEMLSPCAFALPFLFLYYRRISNDLMRLFFVLVPAWVAVMFYQAVIIESRIFNEIIPYCAVISVLIFEATYMGPTSRLGRHREAEVAANEHRMQERTVAP